MIPIQTQSQTKYYQNAVLVKYRMMYAVSSYGCSYFSELEWCIDAMRFIIIRCI